MQTKTSVRNVETQSGSTLAVRAFHVSLTFSERVSVSVDKWNYEVTWSHLLFPFIIGAPSVSLF